MRSAYATKKLLTSEKMSIKRIFEHIKDGNLMLENVSLRERMLIATAIGTDKEIKSLYEDFCCDGTIISPVKERTIKRIEQDSFANIVVDRIISMVPETETEYLSWYVSSISTSVQRIVDTDVNLLQNFSKWLDFEQEEKTGGKVALGLCKLMASKTRESMFWYNYAKMCVDVIGFHSLFKELHKKNDFVVWFELNELVNYGIVPYCMENNENFEKLIVTLKAELPSKDFKKYIGFIALKVRQKYNYTTSCKCLKSETLANCFQLETLEDSFIDSKNLSVVALIFALNKEYDLSTLDGFWWTANEIFKMLKIEEIFAETVCNYIKETSKNAYSELSTKEEEELLLLVSHLFKASPPGSTLFSALRDIALKSKAHEEIFKQLF